jgi:hypothetical protein
MCTTFEECDPGGRTGSLGEDSDDEDYSGSEYTDLDSSFLSTSSVAELLATTDSARTYEEDNTTSQRFQTRPKPRVPLALQAAYLQSCRELVVEEPPPQAALYISERVSLFAICLVSGVWCQR